jgi:nitrite reductase/ring-hydroxylating ferredoxin subunit
MKYRLILWIALLFTVGCGEYEHPTVPNAAVNFTIYPNDPNYGALNHYGGYMYFTGGVNGIIVYRLDYNTFVAYDRACPYDWQEKDAWLWVEAGGLTIIDSCCGSRFNILDGSVINNPARYPLKYYKTQFDGMRLRVWN